MQNDVLRNWKHLRGEVSSQWAHVNEEDLNRVDGQREKLVSLLEHNLGLARRRAEREVDLLVVDLETKLKRAS